MICLYRVWCRDKDSSAQSETGLSETADGVKSSQCSQTLPANSSMPPLLPYLAPQTRPPPQLWCSSTAGTRTQGPAAANKVADISSPWVRCYKQLSSCCCFGHYVSVCPPLTWTRGPFILWPLSGSGHGRGRRQPCVLGIKHLLGELRHHQGPDLLAAMLVRAAKPGVKECRQGNGTMSTASFLRSALSWPGKRRQAVTSLMVADTR